MNVYYDILVDICTYAYTISAHRFFKNVGDNI